MPPSGRLKDNPVERAWPLSSPRGIRSSERPFGGTRQLPPPDPFGLQRVPPHPPSPLLPSYSGACCSPPWLLYLFILHQRGCCRLILAWFKKRETGKKKKKKEKCFLALFSTSVLAAAATAATAAAAAGQAAGRRAAGSEAHRGGVGLRCSSIGRAPCPGQMQCPT